MEKVSLLKLFHRKDCLGWAWAVNDKQGRYVWHNSNDLGLMCDIDECTMNETVLKKIKMGKRAYLYILRNNWNYDSSCEEPITLPQLKACLKECFTHYLGQLTKHEKMLVRRAEGR